MHRKNLIQQSQTLTSLSLESYINDITSQGDNVMFQSLLRHQHIDTVRGEILQILKLFSSGKYRHYAGAEMRGYELNDKQIDTIRKLTVLSQFEGMKSVSMLKLKHELGMQEEQVIHLLMEMNIAGTIDVKIDQKKSVVIVKDAEIRMRNVKAQEIQEVSVDLFSIMKNRQIVRNIKNIKDMIN